MNRITLTEYLAGRALRVSYLLLALIMYLVTNIMSWIQWLDTIGSECYKVGELGDNCGAAKIRKSDF